MIAFRFARAAAACSCCSSASRWNCSCREVFTEFAITSAIDIPVMPPQTIESNMNTGYDADLLFRDAWWLD